MSRPPFEPFFADEMSDELCDDIIELIEQGGADGLIVSTVENTGAVASGPSFVRTK